VRDAHIINKVMQLGRIRENQDHQCGSHDRERSRRLGLSCIG